MEEMWNSNKVSRVGLKAFRDLKELGNDVIELPAIMFAMGKLS